jgi:hypothetical protein
VTIIIRLYYGATIAVARTCVFALAVALSLRSSSAATRLMFPSRSSLLRLLVHPLVMALFPSAAANRRFGSQVKPEITPPPIPTNPWTAPAPADSQSHARAQQQETRPIWRGHPGGPLRLLPSIRDRNQARPY